MLTTKKKTIYKAILSVWYPLTLTWILMSIEGPILTALIALGKNPVENLAAFGVSYAFALLFESPVIMLITASTKLTDNKQSYRSMLNFTHFLCGITVLLHLFLLVPQVYSYISHALRLSNEIAHRVYISLIYLLPWSPAIGYRRFYQGILIRNHQTKRVMQGTSIRLIALLTTSFFLFFFTKIEGAEFGAITLSVAVICEAIMACFLGRSVILPKKREHTPELTLKKIFHFYHPLALTSFIALGTQPFVTFMVSYCTFPLDSLAVLPVINGITLLFRCIGLSYQEVCVTFMNKSKRYMNYLQEMAIICGSLLSLVYFILAYTPLIHLWLKNISSLKENLITLSIPAIRLMFLIPVLGTVLAYKRSIALHINKSTIVSSTILLEVLGILIIMSIMAFFKFSGAFSACLAIILGRVIGVLSLQLLTREHAQSLRKTIPSSTSPSNENKQQSAA